MKAWAWMVVVPIVGSLAHAESLGDVAKRERERRDKKGEAARTPVIREEQLTAGPGTKSKGTFSPAAGSAGGRVNADATKSTAKPSPSSLVNGNPPRTEVDIKRAAARDRLEASYESIRETSGFFLRAIVQYRQCNSEVIPASRSCAALASRIWSLANAIATGMENAEDAARQGWLNPGEVRDARLRYGMADAFWDELVREVQKYRR